MANFFLIRPQFRRVDHFTCQRKRNVPRALRRRQSSSQRHRVDEIAKREDVSARGEPRRRARREGRANARQQDLQEQSDTQ